MKKRLAQWVSCYLALSLALGGAVALSPMLHVWMEHGGTATWHTHLNGWSEIAANFHPPVGDHSHAGELMIALTPKRRNGLFEHSYEPFQLPNLSALRHSLHAVLHWLGGRVPTAREPSPSGDRPGHQHHSLPQLLAGGAVDQPLDLPLLPLAPVSVTHRALPTHTPLLVGDWDAQMASRGPPTAQS